MATQQEPALPREILSLGRPQQIHAARVTSTSLVLLGAGVFFLLAAGLCVIIYLKVPFKKDDPTPPETMLYIAAGIGCVGLLSCLGAWWKGDFGKGSGAAYLIYPDALVWLREESFDLVRWNEITELLSPKHSGDYHIATRDGRTLPIKHGVKDYSSLIGTVFTRVSSEIIPPLHSALAAGQTVTFGPFEVRRDSIGYKGKFLAWEDVAVLQVEIGSLGRRLRLRASGSLLPWCFCNLESFPNGVLFPELIRVVCPPRLLVPVRSR
jgi:hypothetical protein